MFSQIFILSPRGDTIINRDFRSDLPKSVPETFFRFAKTFNGDADPLGTVDGIQFIHIKRGGLYLVGTSRFNISPSLAVELLERLAKEIQDFCGLINEEVLRKNFILIYELLDEIFDFGYPQLTSTEQIKPLIVNEPLQIQSDNLLKNISPTIRKMNIFTPNTVRSDATQVSVLDRKGANEIFIDLYERLNVLFNSTGYVINQSIEGSIQMKSFLQGNPPLKLALNDDLQIGRNSNQYGGVILDDCNFHECVNTNDFDVNKTLKISPPDGQFAVMNYRINGDYQAPFRIFPFIEEISSSKIEVTVKIKACYDAKTVATYATIKIPIPKQSGNAYVELQKNAQNETAEYDQNKKLVEWQIKRLQGGQEKTLKIKITLLATQNAHTARKEIGPVTMNFEIPMYNVSHLSNILELRRGEIALTHTDGSDISHNRAHMFAEFDYEQIKTINSVDTALFEQLYERMMGKFGQCSMPNYNSVVQEAIDILDKRVNNLKKAIIEQEIVLSNLDTIYLRRSDQQSNYPLKITLLNAKIISIYQIRYQQVVLKVDVGSSANYVTEYKNLNDLNFDLSLEISLNNIKETIILSIAPDKYGSSIIKLDIPVYTMKIGDQTTEIFSLKTGEQDFRIELTYQVTIFDEAVVTIQLNEAKSLVRQKIEDSNIEIEDYQLQLSQLRTMKNSNIYELKQSNAILSYQQDSYQLDPNRFNSQYQYNNPLRFGYDNQDQTTQNYIQPTDYRKTYQIDSYDAQRYDDPTQRITYNNNFNLKVPDQNQPYTIQVPDYYNQPLNYEPPSPLQELKAGAPETEVVEFNDHSDSLLKLIVVGIILCLIVGIQINTNFDLCVLMLLVVSIIKTGKIPTYYIAILIVSIFVDLFHITYERRYKYEQSYQEEFDVNPIIQKIYYYSEIVGMVAIQAFKMVVCFKIFTD